MAKELLVPEKTCWRVGVAESAAPLVDGESYFESLYQNLPLAQRTIYFLAWDFDSRQPLIARQPAAHEPAAALGHFLEDVLRKNKDLNIYFLSWDCTRIFGPGRELFQAARLSWQTSDRLHFRFDSEHPLTSSHHQKVVVIDDQLAYAGGMDLTKARWDSIKHEPFDSRRALPDGGHYAPFHDVQMVVQGEPASWLGDLCRERWRLCTGEALAKPSTAAATPAFKLPNFCFDRARLGVSRTIPAFKGTEEVREVERLFLDMIAAARDYIYIENQYFTATLIVDALKESLASRSGPEIILILPKKQDNWLSRLTMGNLADVAIMKLRAADEHHRFHVYYPDDDRLEGDLYINVHAKIMVVDSKFLRIGSANLNNRSMGLDTECDLSIDATDDPSNQKKIAELVVRMASHFIETTVDNFNETWRQTRSLARTIQIASEGKRKSLRSLNIEPSLDQIDAMVTEIELVDPERPVSFDRLIDGLMWSGRAKKNASRRTQLQISMGQIFVLSLFLAVAVAFWRPTTPAPWMFLGGGLLMGLGGLPLSFLATTAAAIYSGGTAFTLMCVIGVVVGGFGYGAGRILNPRFLHRGALYVMRQPNVRRRILVFALVRMFPLAPYLLTSMAAGRTKVEFRPYVAGSLLAGIPTLILLILYQHTLDAAVTDPGVASIAATATFLILIASAFKWSTWRLGTSDKKGDK